MKIRPLKNKTFLNFNLARLEFFKRNEKFSQFTHVILIKNKRFKVKSYFKRKKRNIINAIFTTSFWNKYFHKIYNLHYMFNAKI